MVTRTAFTGLEHSTNVIHDERIFGCMLGILLLKISICVEQIIVLFFEDFSIITLEQKYTVRVRVYIQVHPLAHNTHSAISV
jgi:hypothetical protein